MFRYLILFMTLFFSFIYGEDKGEASAGEIEILSDPQMIKTAQSSVEKRLIKQGYSQNEAKTYSQTGIVAQDSYYTFFRDAVKFPSGHLGTYDRVIPCDHSDEGHGVVTLALNHERKIVLIVSYRHALRAWTLELPRGKIEKYETSKEAAIRELQEETGFKCENAKFLGRIAPDSGILSTENSIYFTDQIEQLHTNHDISEAISGCQLFTLSELKAAISKGEIELTIHGKRQRVLVIDGFTSHALLLAESSGLLSD